MNRNMRFSKKPRHRLKESEVNPTMPHVVLRMDEMNFSYNDVSCCSVKDKVTRSTVTVKFLVNSQLKWK